jgi:hypothetical protein
MLSPQYSIKQWDLNPELASAGGRRFTIDGSPGIERRLADTCARVAQGVRSIVPERQLEAIVLGGGYGRGEGGVLRAGPVEQPYNDLEFYVFLRGNYLWQRYRYQTALHALGESLSPEAGVMVEFKLDSLRRFQPSPVSMFSYDLVARHRVVFGEEPVFGGCGHHLRADMIPMAEATRLLFNRCSGLLLVRELLERTALSNEEADFTVRNLAKAKLALGDALLTAFGLYHWSSRERHRRLAKLRPASGSVLKVSAAGEGQVAEESAELTPKPETLPWLEEVQEHHAAGLEFKLHPYGMGSQGLDVAVSPQCFRGKGGRGDARRCRTGPDAGSVLKVSAAMESGAARRGAGLTPALLRPEFLALSGLALELWLWLESRRLNHRFSSGREYAFDGRVKCQETIAWRNYLLTLRTFGFKGIVDSGACRYPRERLFNALTLLLWEDKRLSEPRTTRRLQQLLRTTATDWGAMLGAYRRVWAGYG